jgi:glycine dehydrogenase subunit 2
MKAIAREVEEDPQIVVSAPHNTRVARMDETTAARKPILRWKPEQKTQAKSAEKPELVETR